MERNEGIARVAARRGRKEGKWVCRGAWRSE